MKTKKFVDGTVSPKINFNLNEGLNTVGDTLKGIFKKPDTYITNNTTVQSEEENDNTMLYVGIGGAVLVVVILLVMMRK